jgi:hypothetical protein
MSLRDISWIKKRASFTSSVNLSWMVDDVLAMSESVSSKPLETESFIGEVNEAKKRPLAK